MVVVTILLLQMNPSGIAARGPHRPNYNLLLQMNPSGIAAGNTTHRTRQRTSDEP